MLYRRFPRNVVGIGFPFEVSDIVRALYTHALLPRIRETRRSSGKRFISENVLRVNFKPTKIFVKNETAIFLIFCFN